MGWLGSLEFMNIFEFFGNVLPVFNITEQTVLVQDFYLKWTSCKFFTYVTKTRANLTTYSRKPENYNGIIIFEIDIMKNSSPINLNLCQT